MVKDEFSVAFQSFTSLEQLSTGDQFGFYGQNIELQRGIPRPRPQDILPIILASSSPQLASLTIGDQSHGCLMTSSRFLQAERYGNGALIKLRNLDDEFVP